MPEYVLSVEVVKDEVGYSKEKKKKRELETKYSTMLA